jgi:serine/threonine protein kinase
MIAGRYRIIEPLGRGSFAAAYRCEDTRDGGDVVVKLYDLKRSSWRLLTAFERETAVLETLTHPAIPRYVEHGQLPEGRLMLVQSCAPGKSLADCRVSRSLTAFCSSVQEANRALEDARRREADVRQKFDEAKLALKQLLDVDPSMDVDDDSRPAPRLN